MCQVAPPRDGPRDFRAGVPHDSFRSTGTASKAAKGGSPNCHSSIHREEPGCTTEESMASSPRPGLLRRPPKCWTTCEAAEAPPAGTRTARPMQRTTGRATPDASRDHRGGCCPGRRSGQGPLSGVFTFPQFKYLPGVRVQRRGESPRNLTERPCDFT